MIALSGRYTPVMLVVCLLMTGIAGATVGAHSAAEGGEPVDMFDRLHEESFTEDGDLKETEPPETQPEAIADFNERFDDVVPETPQRDRWAREHIAKPMILGAFHVADAGFRVGYAMATTLGLGVTKVLLNGAVVGLLAGVALYTVNLFRGVAR